MTLHTESDHIHLVTDPTLIVINSEGWPQGIVPYRLGGPSITMRKELSDRFMVCSQRKCSTCWLFKMGHRWPFRNT